MDSSKALPRPTAGQTKIFLPAGAEPEGSRTRQRWQGVEVDEASGTHSLMAGERQVC